MVEAVATARPTRSIRKFNPGTLQSDRELIEQFVVRRQELETVLEVLRGNIDAPSCQHVLVVAPRGRGKTMLLARTAAELRTNHAFSDNLFPVRFMEESHEVFDVADFWLETLFHLAREAQAEYPELARELRKTHVDLSQRWGEREIGDHARIAVLNVAERIDKKLVLIVENLQSLWGNVNDDFGWQLRGVLQSEPRIALLASAISRFKGLDDPQQPFFDLFWIVPLGQLTTEQCRCLWQAVTGDPVGARDIRPLEILTGGNCRLLAIVAGFSEHRSLRRLMEELVRLVDDHTEYFRGHLEVLPKSERRVYIAVIDLWQPSSATEIAARARMDVRVVSTMLGRLAERGAVVTQSTTRSKNKRLYTLAEPLHSIYYKLRRERDEAAVVESLIQFMMAFYDSFMLYGVFDRLFSEVKDVPSVHSGIDRVLEKRPTEQNLRSKVVWDKLEDISKKAWNSKQTEAYRRLQDEIEAAFEEKAYERVIGSVDRYIAEGWDRYGLGPEYYAAYFAHVKADAYFGMEKFEKTISIGNEVLERLQDSRNPFILYHSSLTLYRKVLAHFELGDYRGTVSSVEVLIDWFGQSKNPDYQKIVAYALMIAADAQQRLGSFEAAISLLDNVKEHIEKSETLEIQIPVAEPMVVKANIVRTFKKDDEGALTIYNEAIERFGDSDISETREIISGALMGQAFAQAGLGDFEGEIESYNRVIERADGSDAAEEKASAALTLKALRLAEIGRTEEALIASDELERRFGTLREVQGTWVAWMGMVARAIALTVRQDATAIDTFRMAYARFPTGNEIATRLMIRVVLNLIAVGARESELAEILASDIAKSRSIAPLVVALRQRVGEIVRAPPEVLEVAADIRKILEEKSVKGILIAI